MSLTTHRKLRVTSVNTSRILIDPFVKTWLPSFEMYFDLTSSFKHTFVDDFTRVEHKIGVTPSVVFYPDFDVLRFDHVFRVLHGDLRFIPWFFLNLTRRS